MGRESKGARSVFRTVLLVGLVWLCLAGRSRSSSGAETSMEWKGSNQREELLLHSHSHHLNSVSKRRVPNGPDPIHNRRTVKSRQPPTRA